MDYFSNLVNGDSAVEINSFYLQLFFIQQTHTLPTDVCAVTNSDDVCRVKRARSRKTHVSRHIKNVCYCSK